MATDGDPAPAQILAILGSNTLDVLGNGLVGLYVYGSWVTGGYDAGVSDLDLVAVTTAEADDLDLLRLGAMHERLADRYPGWRDRIEVVYVGRASLRAFRTSRGHLAVISPGEPFHLREDPAVVWLQNWYLVRETGVTLHGPPARDLVPVVDRPEFVAATRRYAGEVREQSRSGVPSGYLAYTILTMCRAAALVLTDTTAGKREAATWARDRWPEWRRLIDAALACRLAGGRIGFDDERSRAEAEDFIRLIGTLVADAPDRPETRPRTQSL